MIFTDNLQMQTLISDKSSRLDEELSHNSEL